MLMRLRSYFSAVLALPLLVSCGSADDSTLAVAMIATPEELSADGLRISASAQHLRAATEAGLVARDAQGDIIPALAESWLVTDDGLSYIFRLRENRWPDDSEVTAEHVRRSLERSCMELRGTSLALDLAAIAEIRAMTGRVLELRLSTPVPDLLMLLAQPELAVRSERGSLGQMEIAKPPQTRTAPDTQSNTPQTVTLRFRPPETSGLPVEEDWQKSTREITIEALDGRTAIERFYEGELDLVLGGTIGYMPLVDTGPLTRGTARVDPAIGLFGLHIQTTNGALASDTLREALAMAIDREALLSLFGVGGWLPTNRIVSPGLPNDNGFIGERWIGQTIEERRAEAQSRLAGLSDSKDGLTLAIAMDETPGHAGLFNELAAQWALVGVTLELADDRASADIILIDRVARYADAKWFLNQFHCSLRRGLCNAEVDEMIAAALQEPDAAERSIRLAEAEAALTLDNIYIPLGQPLRWSLARGRVEPYEGNPWAFHPLPPMALIPN